ncbi:MAG: M14 family metallopeptidase [Actinomycetota bacterium]
MAGFEFNRFYKYDELTALLHQCAAEHPDLCTVESIGRSHEGRDIWLVTLTNQATGPHSEKPAHWVDASIHATELAGSVAALHLIDRLLSGHGSDDRVTRALDTRTVYVVPRINPDGAEWALADKPRHVRSGTRPYPRLDEQDGLAREDVDGDGRILTMRIRDDNGPWKAHPDEPRLLVAREPDEDDPNATYWRVLPEGVIRNFDGVMITIAPSVQGLDLNRNFPPEWRPEGDQRGAGPYPTSEPEIRALVQAIVDRPNICSYLTYHTFSGVHLRPYGHQSDDAFATSDLRTYEEIGRRATAITGYKAVSVWHGFRYDPKDVITGVADDWAYDHLGVYAWTTELWSPLQRIDGIGEYDFIKWFDDHPVEHDLALLRWADEATGRTGYVDWYSFDHPQLGPVELGGWNFIETWTNPPFVLLEKEIAPHTDLALLQTLMTPRLRLRSSEATSVGADTWRVRVVVENSGWLPSNVSQRALDRKVVRPLEAEISLPAGAELATGKATLELGQLTGRALKQNTTEIVGAGDPTTDRALAEWVVRAPQGSTVHVEARHQRAGVVRCEVTLG